MARKKHKAGTVGFDSIPTASGGIARAGFAAAIKAGLDVDALLRNAGLTTVQAKSADMRIPVKSQIKFLNEVADALQDEFLGIHLAQRVDLRELGLIYYVLASSDNLGDALGRAARYSTIHNEGVQINLRRHKYISIVFDYVGVSRASDRHQIEFFVAILIRLCRELTGRQISPVTVRLTHRRSSLPFDVKALFACTVNFGARVDEVVFPLDTGSVPMVNADPYLNALLLRYCEEAVSRRRAKEGHWRTRVENAIAPLLPHGEATIDNIAQRLGLSRRTLARRLAEENVTFLEVLNELRLSLAKRYLCERGLTVAQIAWLLGYQEISAFSHAVKRWTGEPPTRLRAHEAGPGTGVLVSAA